MPDNGMRAGVGRRKKAKVSDMILYDVMCLCVQLSAGVSTCVCA